MEPVSRTMQMVYGVMEEYAMTQEQYGIGEDVLRSILTAVPRIQPMLSSIVGHEDNAFVLHADIISTAYQYGRALAELESGDWDAHCVGDNEYVLRHGDKYFFVSQVITTGLLMAKNVLTGTPVSYQVDRTKPSVKVLVPYRSGRKFTTRAGHELGMGRELPITSRVDTAVNADGGMKIPGWTYYHILARLLLKEPIVLACAGDSDNVQRNIVEGYRKGLWSKVLHYASFPFRLDRVFCEEDMTYARVMKGGAIERVMLGFYMDTNLFQFAHAMAQPVVLDDEGV